MSLKDFDEPTANGTIVLVGNRQAEIHGNQQLEQPTSYLVVYLDEKGGNEWVSADNVSTDVPLSE